MGVQDQDIDNLKTEQKENIARADIQISSIIKLIEEEKQAVQQQFDDSGICMADIEEKLETLSENDDLKNKTMDDLNKSFEESITNISSKIEVKLAEDQKSLTNRLKMAEENIKNNNESININASLIQKNTDAIKGLYTSTAKLNDEILNAQEEFERIDEQLQNSEKAKEIEVEAITNNFKRMDKLISQLSDLDDVVTQLSPDIQNNSEKITILEKFKNMSEQETNNLQGIINNIQDKLNQDQKNMEDTLQKQEMKIISLQGEQKEQLERIVSLHETTVVYEERAKVVDASIQQSA